MKTCFRMEITSEDVERARQKDLPRLLSLFGQDLRRKGEVFWCNCPFHNEKTPSFKVERRGGHWRFHCFGCGESGDIIDFVRKKGGHSFPKAIETLLKI